MTSPGLDPDLLPRVSPRRAIAAVAVVIALVAAAAGPVTGQELPPVVAQEDPPPPEEPKTPEEIIADLVPDQELSAGLARLQLESDDYESAVAGLLVALNDLEDAEDRKIAAEGLVGQLAEQRVTLKDDLAELRAERRSMAVERDVAVQALRVLAVTQFVAEGSEEDVDQIALDPSRMMEASQLGAYTTEVAEVNAATIDRLDGEIAVNEAAVAETIEGLANIARGLVEARDEIEDQTVRAYLIRTEMPAMQEAVRNARWGSLVRGLDLPLVVLDAYVRAARTVSAQRPGCGVEWWMLAGIGRVESGHGTFGGAVVQADGTATPPIIGIPLSGARNTAVILDSDGGLLDGDVVYDRAVGPMQFIPTTWAVFAVDGNGDGYADPHNLYDVATAAANYLCRAAGSVANPAGLDRAYFAYNHSLDYVNKVRGFAFEYRNFNVPAA